MSNSTRPGGYDERLVVPLEASRRGAHRARTSPLVAALPLLAVVAVVAVVIGVTYALFLRPSGSNVADDGVTPVATPRNSAPATTEPSASVPATDPTPEPSASASSPAATVNKNIAISVYNGTSNNGTPVNGLAKTTLNQIESAGFTKAKVNTAPWTATPISETTVFYGSDASAPTAQALVKALGVGKVEKASSLGAGIAVVAFSDLKR